MSIKNAASLVWIIALAAVIGFSTAACESEVNPGDTSQTPVADDFNIGNLTQTAGTVTAVTITPKEGKSTGTVTIYYDGETALPTEAGTYPVTFDVAAASGWKAANGLSAGTLTVNPKVMTFTVDSIPAQTYNGSAHTPTITVKDGTTTRTLTVDYTVEYSNNTNAGTATVTVTGAGNYVGSTGSTTFTINKAAGAAVASPTASSISLYGITLNPVTASTGQTVEYAKSNSTTAPSSGWQTGLDFTGLSDGTAYYFFARSVENANYTTGTPSAGASIATSSLTVIASAETHITPPVTGITPDTAATGTGDFSIGTVSWSPTRNPFQGGTVYTATVTLTANSGHTFTGLSHATINGVNAAVSNNTGAAVTLSYTFPATDTRTATNMAIKSQPAKLVYTHGDTLDLTGLVMTLTFNDTSTDDVAAANFGGHNIGANPAHGDDLNRSEHNGKGVTVTYGSLTQTTNALTVSPKVMTFTVDAILAQTYNGSAHTPTVTVKDGTTTLTLTADYTAAYANNTNAGTATITITGAGNYAGSNGSASFTINKAAGAAVAAPTAASVTAYTVTLNAAPATGQTVEYARNNTVTAPSTGWQTGTTFDGLASGASYYFFARSAQNDNYNTGAASGGTAIATLATTAGITLDVKQITDGAPIIGSVTISRTGSGGNPVTYPVTVDNPSQYGSISWEVAGVGAYAGQTVTGTDPTFTLDAADVRYNALGTHALILSVTKDGMRYQRAIPFTIVQ